MPTEFCNLYLYPTPPPPPPSGLAAEDYYTILGLSKGASDQDIKRSFYKLAKKYHPDTNKVGCVYVCRRGWAW
jgi:hypothetical protein